LTTQRTLGARAAVAGWCRLGEFFAPREGELPVVVGVEREPWKALSLVRGEELWWRLVLEVDWDVAESFVIGVRRRPVKSRPGSL